MCESRHTSHENRSLGAKDGQFILMWPSLAAVVRGIGYPIGEQRQPEKPQKDQDPERPVLWLVYELGPLLCHAGGCARVGSPGRVMHQPEGRTAGCLLIMVEPRATRLEISRSRAGCYHFATQLDGTRHNGPGRRDGGAGALGRKTLTRRHAAGRGDMARIEAHIPAQD